MISNKLLNPHIIEALTSLSEEGLVSLNPVLEKLMNELMKVEENKLSVRVIMNAPMIVKDIVTDSRIKSL